MKNSTLLITVILIITSTVNVNADDSKQQNWRTELATSLPVLGHRNFIVVADSAYPLQSNPGIKTIYTGSTQIAVVKEVLAAVDKASHVNGTVYVDKELTYVPEHNAKGIKAYRKSLDQILAGRDIQRLPHMEIIKKLDAGYWNGKSEAELRESMK